MSIRPARELLFSVYCENEEESQDPEEGERSPTKHLHRIVIGQEMNLDRVEAVYSGEYSGFFCYES